jgi:hypothetical protein
MAWITLAEAKATLRLWMDAERACASGKSYTIGSRSLTRTDLEDIADRIRFWRAEVARLEAGRGEGMRVLRVVPRDW